MACNRENLEQLTDRVMHEIADMLPKEMRGVYTLVVLHQDLLIICIMQNSVCIPILVKKQMPYTLIVAYPERY